MSDLLTYLLIPYKFRHLINSDLVMVVVLDFLSNSSTSCKMYLAYINFTCHQKHSCFNIQQFREFSITKHDISLI